MRHLVKIFALLVLFLLFSACATPLPAEKGAPPAPSASPSAELPRGSSAAVTPEVRPSPPPDYVPASEPGNAPAPVDWQKIYRKFIEAKYDKLLETFLSGIAGIGFADLDLDGVPELLIFDLGASASMGVQIFDIAAGEAECVSSNVAAVGEAFGGAHMSAAGVSVNEFASFRLLRNKSTGERVFIARSGNGALDFLYSAIIKFGRGESGEVTVTKYLSRYEEYSESGGETRTVTGRAFEYLGQSVDEERYTALLEEFNTAWEDEGYEARGIFIWESAAYERELGGLIAMYDAAVKAYIPIPD